MKSLMKVAVAAVLLVACGSPVVDFPQDPTEPADAGTCGCHHHGDAGVDADTLDN